MDRSDGETATISRSDSSPRARLVGLDGEELAGLAHWLKAGGLGVTGPRPVMSRLDPAQPTLSGPHPARWLVYGPGVAREHPDRLVALRDGIAQVSHLDLIRGMLSKGVGIAVAGRRQGRVAAAMIGWTLEQAGMDPAVLLRSGSPQLGGLARAGAGRHAVVDVTDRPEVLLSGAPGPAVVVLMDDQSLGGVGGLGKVAEGLGAGEVVVLATEPEDGSPVDLGRAAVVETLSLERGSTWWGADLREDRGRYRFRAFHRGRFAAEIRLRVPGRSSVLSALAAVAACGRVEVPAREIKHALEDFAGISRGFESRGSYRGVTLLDDDAAGSGGVGDALELVRSVHGRRRLWVVYRPACPPSGPTTTALSGADRVTILGGPVDSGPWAGMLERAGIVARQATDLDDVVSDLDRNLEPGDVLLTLGAGDVGTIADAFLRRLPRDRQGR